MTTAKNVAAASKPAVPSEDELRASIRAEMEAEAAEAVEAKAAAAGKNGYYRTVENVIVHRMYSGEDGISYSQSVAQGPGGELPEGVTNKDITND